MYGHGKQIVHFINWNRGASSIRGAVSGIDVTKKHCKSAEFLEVGILSQYAGCLGLETWLYVVIGSMRLWHLANLRSRLRSRLTLIRAGHTAGDRSDRWWLCYDTTSCRKLASSWFVASIQVVVGIVISLRGCFMHHVNTIVWSERKCAVDWSKETQLAECCVTNISVECRDKSWGSAFDNGAQFL